MSTTSTTGQRRSESAPSTGAGRAILVAIGLAILATVVGTLLYLVGTTALSFVGIEIPLEADLTAGTFLFSALATQGGMALVAYWYIRRYGLSVPIQRLQRSNYPEILVGVVVAVTLALGVSTLTETLFASEGGSVYSGVNELGLTTVLAFGAITLFIVAPAEEYLFRGVIQGRLRQTMGVVPAILAASTVFGAVHFLNFTGSAGFVVVQVATIAIVSLVFAYAYERTNNLTVPILIHGIYDASLFVISYLTL